MRDRIFGPCVSITGQNALTWLPGRGRVGDRRPGAPDTPHGSQAYHGVNLYEAQPGAWRRGNENGSNRQREIEHDGIEGGSGEGGEIVHRLLYLAGRIP